MSQHKEDPAVPDRPLIASVKDAFERVLGRWKVDPAAQEMPRPTQDQFRALVADVRARGLVERISTYTDANGENVVLDGLSRLAACLEAEVEPLFKEVERPAEALAVVLSLNLTRRHLSSVQRACIAVRHYLPTVRREAQERMRAGRTHPPEHSPEGPSRKGEAVEIAGRQAGVSGKLVRQCERIADPRKGDTDLFQAMWDGLVPSMPAAQRLLKLPKTERRDVLMRIRDGAGIREAVKQRRPTARRRSAQKTQSNCRTANTGNEKSTARRKTVVTPEMPLSANELVREVKRLFRRLPETARSEALAVLAGWVEQHTQPKAMKDPGWPQPQEETDDVGSIEAPKKANKKSTEERCAQETAS